MNEAKQEILNIIAKYCEESPHQRFGQILFNLNINEFKKETEEIFITILTKGFWKEYSQGLNN